MMIMTVIHHRKKYKDDNNDDIYDCNDNSERYLSSQTIGNDDNDETNSELSLYSIVSNDDVYINTLFNMNMIILFDILCNKSSNIDINIWC